MDRRDQPQWRYKTRAIDRSAQMLAQALPKAWLARVTFVPMPPPSKMRGHVEYDDRLVQILSKVGSLKFRELIVAIENIDPAHLTEDRRSVADFRRALKIDDSLRNPRPEAICIFDDVLTTGAHFKAAQTLLLAEFTGTPMAGLFLARRAPLASPI